MFDSMREHYDSIASRWEFDHERFAGEEIDPWDGDGMYEDDDPAGISLVAMYPNETLGSEEPDEEPDSEEPDDDPDPF
jgi:hypothetical protein